MKKVSSLVMLLILAVFFLGGCIKKTEMHHHDNKTHEKTEEAKSKFTCPMHPQIVKDETGTCPICGMDLVAVEGNSPNPTKGHDHGEHAKYTCPMHPQIVKDEAGACPICGMDLVKVEKSSSNSGELQSDLPKGHAQVHLSLEKQQLIGVKVSPVEKKSLFKSIRAPGQVAFDPELYTAQTEYQEALRQLQRVKESPLGSVKKNVKRMVESAKIRLRVLGLSEEQIRAIRPRTKLSDSLLLSKQKGNIWIYAEVFEIDLRNIEKGQSVKISSNYLEGEVIPGTVISTDEVINPKTRTAKVRIQIKSSKARLRPHSFVDVSILVPQGEHLAVSEDAIVDTGEENFVFVDKGNGHFEPRKILISFRAGEQVAVAEGLSEGDQIVTSANFLIDSESRLKGVLTQMAGGHNH